MGRCAKTSYLYSLRDSFLVNFAKYLIKLILKTIFKQLLLNADFHLAKWILISWAISTYLQMLFEPYNFYSKANYINGSNNFCMTSKIVHSSKQHCRNCFQIKQNSSNKNKKYSLKLRSYFFESFIFWPTLH